MQAGGLIGLTNSTNKRDSARADLNTMMNMLNLKKQDEQMEMQANEQIQQTIAGVKAEASNLLEGDRMAIRTKAREFEKDIRDRLKANGGSAQAFLKNGGHQALRDYQSKVLQSNEFTTYQENKSNMERILLIKEKKMGHLLNEKDLNSLRVYQTTGKGKISYTGLLNEVEVDPMAYEFGHNVTPEEVLANANNKMAIIANFEADTGQVYNRTYNDEVLKKYIAYKGYGGVGKNQQLLSARLAAAAKAKKEAQQVTAAVSVGQAVNSIGEVAFDQMNHNTDNSKGFVNKDNTAILNAKPNQSISHIPPGYITWGALPGVSAETKKGNGFRLKGGATILQGKEADLMGEYLGEKIVPDDTGHYIMDPRTMRGTYDASGSVLTERSTMRGWENSYKPMEISLAYKGKDKDGKEILITEAMSGGEVDDKANADLYGGSTPSGNGTVVVRMHDDQNPGFDFYQEIDVNSVAHQAMFAKYMKDDNDLSDTIKEQKQIAAGMESANVQAKAQVKKLDDTALNTAEAISKKSKDNEALTGTTMEMEKAKYRTAGMTRDNLVASFYQLAGGGDAEKTETFMQTKQLDQALDGYQIKEMMLDEKFTDQQIMQAFYKKDTEGQNDMQAYINYKTWLNLYNNNLK